MLIINLLVCSRKTDNAFKVQSFGLASDDLAWNHGQFDQPLNDKAKCWHIRVPDFSVHTFRTQRSRTVKVRIEKSGTQKFTRPSRLKSPEQTSGFIFNNLIHNSMDNFETNLP